MTNEEFDEEALKRALGAPGSPTELAGEQTYREMFRAARSPAVAMASPAPGRTAVRRLGTGATLAVVVALATGGVAAAYSSNLPAPVQRAVHSVLSPLGVPAAEPERPVVTARHSPEPEPEPEVPAPSAPPAVHPSHSPSVRPSHKPSPLKTVEPSPSTDPSASETPVLPSESPTDVPSSTGSTDPSSSPQPSQTGTPSPSTPPTPPAPVPATVKISSAGAGSKVAPGGTAVVTGRVVAADGTPVPDVRVVLQQRGTSGWQRVASVRTAADGSVAVATGPVQSSTRVRLKTGKVRSTPWRLVVQPSVTATAQTVGTVATVTARVTGGQVGDRVVLVSTRGGQVAQEGAATLGADGVITFDVTAPALDRWYVVRLPATAGHGAARVRVLVGAYRPDPA
jgi:hypothetical protein